MLQAPVGPPDTPINDELMQPSDRATAMLNSKLLEQELADDVDREMEVANTMASTTAILGTVTVKKRTSKSLTANVRIIWLQIGVGGFRSKWRESNKMGREAGQAPVKRLIHTCTLRADHEL